MVKISRYSNYIPTLPDDIQRDIYSKMQKLIEEEKKYCDDGNYKHMSQIFTSIALYRTLQEHGKSEEEAYKITSEEMWKSLTPESYKKMAKLPFRYHQFWQPALYGF